MLAKTIRTFSFENGLALIVAQVPASAAFNLTLHIQAGSRDESPELNGAFHFLEHMMFRGSERYSDSIELAHAIESLGGDNNATTSAETTTFWLEGHAHRLEEAFGIFSEFFFHPTFVDMEIERSILLQELAEDCNEEGHLIETASLGMAALFRDHPLGLPIIGNARNIQRLSREDLKRLRKRHYRPDRSLLVVSSPHEPDLVARWVERHLVSDWARPREASPERRVAPQLLRQGRGKVNPRLQVVTQNNSDSQFDFRLLLPAHGGTGEAVVAQQFLERLLDDGIASRLASKIREKMGLAYDISCAIDAYSDVGTCSISAAMAGESLNPFLQALSEELRRLVQQPPTIDEMERVRSRYLFSARALPENLPAYLDHLVWQSFLGKGALSLEQEIEVVESLTARRILDSAQDVLGGTSRVGVLVGPEGRRMAHSLERFLESLSG